MTFPVVPVVPVADRRSGAGLSLVPSWVDTGESSVQTISCDTCMMAQTSACEDCLVTFLCGSDVERRAVSVDETEADTIRLFQEAGLAPALRHVAYTSRVASGRVGASALSR